MELKTIAIQKAHPNAQIPTYKHYGDAGLDLSAVQNCVLSPGERKAISTGLIINIPFGYEGQIRPRSGLALNHGVTVLNAPGTIDSNYRGEIKVILINHGVDYFRISPGDRIAQLVIAKVNRVLFVEEEIENDTDRGDAGFGSTGV